MLEGEGSWDQIEAPRQTPIGNGSQFTYYERPQNPLIISPYIVMKAIRGEAPEEKIDKVFLPSGEWGLYGADDIPDFYDRPYYDLRTIVRGRLRPVYEIADYSLRSEKWPDGFNRHGISHIDYVSRTTERLLRDAGHGDDLVQLGILAAEGHDVGNPIRRRGHSVESPRVFEAIVPSVLQNRGKWDAVVKAMVLHDEHAILPLIASWGNKSAVLDIQGLRDLGPIACALILADKTDVGRHRANEWALNQETMARDAHAFASFFGENAGFDMRGNEFVWHVRYDPSVTENEREKYGDLVRKRSAHEGYAMKVPEWLHAATKLGNMTHFSGWSNEFMKIYKGRMQLSAMCAFALFPHLEKFVLEMHDPVDKEDLDSGRSMRHVFSLRHLDRQIELQNVIFTPKEEKKRQRSKKKEEELLR